MNIPYAFKKCSKCGEWKVANNYNFYKQKNGKWRLENRCKKCKKNIIKIIKNIEKNIINNGEKIIKNIEKNIVNNIMKIIKKKEKNIVNNGEKIIKNI